MDEDELFIAMEYMEGGDLTDVVSTVTLAKYHFHLSKFVCINCILNV